MKTGEVRIVLYHSTPAIATSLKEAVLDQSSSKARAIQLTAKPLNPIAAPLAAVEGACFSVTGYLALTEQVTN